MNLQEYFENNKEAGYHLIYLEPDLPIRGYIHPHGIDGDTLNFLVQRNEIVMTNSMYQEIETDNEAEDINNIIYASDSDIADIEKEEDF